VTVMSLTVSLNRLKSHSYTIIVANPTESNSYAKTLGGGWRNSTPPRCQNYSVALANNLRSFLELIENKTNLVLDLESRIAI